MSLMQCHLCDTYVDTDDDGDSLHEDKCVCERCREENDLETEFD